MLRRLGCVLLLLALGAGAETFDPPHLTRSWHSEDGLPSNTVRAITQTVDGFMWLGTEGGLSRFDGLRFTNFGPREGVPAVAVRALAGTRDGSLWVSFGNAGFAQYRASQFTRYSVAEGLPANDVTSMSEGPDGTFWVGTTGGVARWDGKRFVALPQPPGNPEPRRILARRNGELWTLSDGPQLRIWKGQDWSTPLAAPHGGFSPHTGLVEDPDGNVWAVSAGGPVLKLSRSGWEAFELREPPAHPIPRPIAAGPAGEICMGHYGAGLWKRKGQVFEPLSADDGTGDALVVEVYYDRDGQLWVGSFSSGLLRLSSQRIESLRLDPVRNADPVRALLETKAGEFLVGTQGIGLWRWADGVGARLSADPAIRGENYGYVLERAPDGRIFTGSHAVRQLDGEKQVAFWALPKAGNDIIRSFAFAGDGTLYIGTAIGRILKLRDNAIEPFAQSAGNDTVWSLAFTADQTLWAATAQGGVRRFQAGRETAFTTAHGLRSNDVIAVYVDSHDTLWAGTRGGGLARWRDTRFESIGREAGLQDDTVMQIIEGPNSMLWLGGPRGISAVSIRDLEAVFAGDAQTVHPWNFGRSDGMASSECMEMRPIRDSAGQLYFGTTRGFVRVDPNLPELGRTAPPILIESFAADGQPYFRPSDGRQPNPVALPPGISRVEIGFTAPEFVAPEQLRFRYRLAGLDTSQTTLARSNTVTFDRLPPGQYRFEVQSALPGGAWSTPATMSFALRPHFWQTRWFLAICGLAGLTAAAGVAWEVARRRAARAVAHLERQHAVDAERGRIAKDLHDDLGASLTEISLFGDLAKADIASPPEALEHLEHICGTAQRSARALDEIIWAANPAHDSLESFVAYLSKQVQDLAKAAGLSCSLKVPPSLPEAVLPSSARHHLFLAAREALHNVAKHAGAKSVSLSLALGPSSLSLYIEDDGRGFDAATDDIHADGLANMRRRMAELGGEFHFESMPGQGTKVALSVPLSLLEPLPRSKESFPPERKPPQ